MTKIFNVLIAEDDLDDQMLMKCAFQDNEIKCNLNFVVDGEKLVSFLREAKDLPDLILLDLNMPKIDGREVLKTIKNTEQFKHIPTMVISTSSAQAEVKNAYSLGAAAYLVKPASYDDLLKLIKDLTAFYFEAVTLSK